jgi:hypothetical protein
MPIVNFLGRWAAPALLDVGALFVSIAYLLLVWGAYVLFAQPLRLVARAVPFIGSQLSDAVGSIADGARSWAQDWAEGNIAGLLRLVVYIPQAVVAIVGTVVGAFEWVLGQLASEGITLLEQSGLIDLAQSMAGDAQNAVAWVRDVHIPDVVSGVLSTVQGWIGSAIATVQADIGTAEAIIRSEVAAVEAGIRTDIQAVQDGIRTDIADVEAGIRTDIQAVQDGIRTDIADVEAGIRTDIADVVAGVQTDLGVVMDNFGTAMAEQLGVNGIFDVIALTTMIFQHPHEAAQQVAAASEQVFHAGDTILEVLTGQAPAVGIGQLAIPPLPAPTTHVPHSTGAP